MAQSKTGYDLDRLIEFRRELHAHPEPAWREFYTTARIVEELERIGVDEIHVGRDALADDRIGVPEDAELETWREQARTAGADPAVLERMEGGWTGAVAVLRRGEGPTVGLRVDIDGLEREESDAGEHTPAAEGFRSEHDGMMHACGHDAHATFGVGVLEAVKASDFRGTLKVFFQPGEEKGVGGKPMADSELFADVEYLLAAHIGLDHPTGEVIAGISGFLAVRRIVADFEGEAAHAGGRPNEGRNAVQAAATAIQNLYGIPRHADGATRVNAGIIGGGSAENIIPEDARISGEVRGETTQLMEYMTEEAERVVEAAAEMHDCDVDFEKGQGLPSGESDEELAAIVAEVGRELGSVETLTEHDDLGGSEDATFMMDRVQERGGLAAYVGIGTDHPGGHHTATFDIDEESIAIGVDVLAGSIERIAAERP